MSSAFSTGDTIAQNQTIDRSSVNQIALTDVWNREQRVRCVRWIEKRALKRVALQFPDSILPHSVQIVSELREALPAGEDASVQLFVLGDTSYGSCCVDEVAASHANADGIVHFGHACLSKVARVPVLYVFFQHALDEARLLAALASEYGTDADHLELSCFYEVGYATAIAGMGETLRARFPRLAIASLADADQQPDTLCWKFNDKPAPAPNHPALYIGRDNLSFFNTAVAIGASEWLRFDPTDSTGEPRLERTDAAGAKWLRRRYYAIERCKDAGSIGIVVATLSTSGYLAIVSRVQQLAKARGVRTYIISIGKVNPEKLANFIDIDCFVLVGCPENDIFTSRDFFRPLLSVYEAEMALNPTWSERLCTAGYTTNFAELLPDGRLYSDVEEVAAAIETGENALAPDVSLVTGRTRDGARRNTPKPVEQDGSGMEVALKGKNEVALISSADHFANRSWQGLEQNLGKDEPALVQEGRSGLPIQYRNDPTQRPE
uniref:2-(3-amino-3-carboxypropyl)histidine synthase subunit 2 n=1 Tax=Anopheles dirus TaxID=7168 RepID=A0A182NVE3_9DIPT